MEWQPHKIETEENVIGGIFKAGSDSKSVASVFSFLSSDDFFKKEHRQIFDVTKQMYLSGDNYDFVLVADKLGGDALTYIGSMVKRTPSAANLIGYARIVKEKAVERHTLAALQDSIAILTSEGETKSKIEEIASMMAVIEQDNSVGAGGVVHIKDIATKWLDIYEDRINNPDAAGIKTGITGLDDLFGNRGVGKTDLNVIGARPKMGKEQPLSSLILLNSGKFKSMGDIKVGDKIASSDGGDNFVTGVFPQGLKKVYKITVSDGRVVECGIDHLWRINSNKFKGERTVTTKKLIEMMKASRNKSAVSLAGHNGSFGCDSEGKINPWLLGFLLGDGALTNGCVRFSTSEADVVEKVKLSIPKCASVKRLSEYDYIITTKKGKENPVLNMLRDCGAYGKKSIEKTLPKYVFSESLGYREQVLAGLIESDGWIQKSSHMFSTSSPYLSDGFSRLVFSVGGTCRGTIKKSPKYTYRGEKRTGKPSHVLSFKIADISKICTTERILKKVTVRTKRVEPSIVSVEFDRYEDSQCISVSHDNHLYITDNYLVTHNTQLAIKMADHIAMSTAKPVMIFSMEMSNEQVFERMLSSSSRVSSDNFYQPMGNAEMDDITVAIAKMAQSDIYIDDHTNMSLAYIRGECRKMKAKKGCIGAVFIDYLTLMKAEKADRNDLAVGAITKGLKNMAKDLKVPVFLLAQLNRGLESRTDKRPIMSDLRETGQIEQDADRIIMIYRESVYETDSPLGGLTELIVRANRHGATGTAFVDMRNGIMENIDTNQMAQVNAQIYDAEQSKQSSKNMKW